MLKIHYQCSEFEQASKSYSYIYTIRTIITYRVHTSLFSKLINTKNEKFL